MSADDTLKTMLRNSLTALADSKKIALDTKRPPNVCDGHDALFGLVRAIADGVETSLLIQADRMTDTQAQPNGMVKQPPGDFWPQAWSLAREKASLIIVCVTAVVISAIAFDRVEKVMAAWREVRADHACAIPYEPAPN